jgi:hypothetical protein
MVKILGRNEYLSKIIKKYRIRLATISLAYLLLFTITLLYPQFVLVTLIFLVFVTISFIKTFSNYLSCLKGFKGELAVEKALRSLDDSYILINDVRLPNARGNIDHIVVGPTGVFVIETKNVSGHYLCEGDYWYRIKNGKVRKTRSISRQASHNAYSLRKFLRKYGCDQYVHCVVVFTNKKCKVDLINPSVPVVDVSNLPKFILRTNTRLPKRKIHEIVGIIVARTNKFK